MTTLETVIKAVLNPKLSSNAWYQGVDYLADCYKCKPTYVMHYINHTQRFRAYPEISEWKELKYHLAGRIPATQQFQTIEHFKPKDYINNEIEYNEPWNVKADQKLFETVKTVKDFMNRFWESRPWKNKKPLKSFAIRQAEKAVNKL